MNWAWRAGMLAVALLLLAGTAVAQGEEEQFIPEETVCFPVERSHEGMPDPAGLAVVGLPWVVLLVAGLSLRAGRVVFAGRLALLASIAGLAWVAVAVFWGIDLGWNVPVDWSPATDVIWILGFQGLVVATLGCLLLAAVGRAVKRHAEAASARIALREERAGAPAEIRASAPPSWRSR